MIITPPVGAAAAVAATTGFSLSPGGLLYPYHIGVLSNLEYHQRLTPQTPIAGSSAGAIAVASHAAQVKPEKCLDTTIRICDECFRQGGARGRLLPLLEAELEAILDEDAHLVVNARPGLTALAYYELFPNTGPILQSHFETREDLTDAILNSSMFPFFSTNWPWRLAKKKKTNTNDNDTDIRGLLANFLPRIAMDGYFTVPFGRFGCPDFEQINKNDGGSTKRREPSFTENVLAMEDKVEDQLARNLAQTKDAIIERTITISVFPHDSVLMTASSEHDRISPLFYEDDPVGQVQELLRCATQPLTQKEVHHLYEEGLADAERWVVEEAKRSKLRDDLLRNEARADWLGRNDKDNENGQT